jgi:SAM-dependent methyltransferase
LDGWSYFPVANEVFVEFGNVYEDARRAEAYAKLEFPGTYYLAYRDLPEIISRYVKGKKAIDFGCGTGRSTRFLQKMGFDVVGIDISQDMINKAKDFDPQGKYHLIKDGDFGRLERGTYDLILSAFTFDNIPTKERKVKLFAELGSLLNGEGKIVNLVSSPDIYINEWESFSTKDFPENRKAKSGDKVKIIVTAIDDKRPVEDIVWPDEDYRKTYKEAGLEIIETRKPLAREDEPFEWVNETKIAPWVIYVLRKS